jgi:hypothetical protein
MSPKYTSKVPIIDVYTTHFGNLLHSTTYIMDRPIPKNIMPTTCRTVLAKIAPTPEVLVFTEIELPSSWR